MNLPVIASAADYDLHFNDELWLQAASLICARHRLPQTNLRRSLLGENIIFFTDSAFVIKIFAPFRSQYLRERAALEFAQGKLAIETPQLLYAGELEGWPYLVMTYLKGVPAREVWVEIEASERLEIVIQLGVAMRELHSHTALLSEEALNRDWQTFLNQKARESVERQRACGANPEWLESLPAYISARLPLLPTEFRRVMLHGDIHPGNVLLAKKNNGWRVVGLFDFGDSFCGFHEYEFVAPGVLMVQGKSEEQRAMLLAYGYSESELDLKLRARLMLLTILYECSDLRKYALRLRSDAIHLTLDELERAIWTFANG
jgi:hygromycin-B 7''-O-kinase